MNDTPTPAERAARLVLVDIHLLTHEQAARAVVDQLRPHLYRELANHIAMFNVRPDEVELVRRIRRLATELEGRGDE